MSETLVPRYLWIDEWNDPLGIPSTGVAEPAAAPSLRLPGPGSSRFRLDVSDEELMTLFAVEPPPVSREELDGKGEELLRYHGLPGGIGV